MQNLEELIRTGSLKTYEITGGFIKIYWRNIHLPKNHYLLFTFTQAQEKLVDIQRVAPKYLPVKYKARTYSKTMEALVKSLA